jgi:hypothetical protein
MPLNLNIPHFYNTKFQVVKEEMNKRKVQDTPCSKKIDELMVFRKSHDQDQFYASLVAAKDKIMCQIQENGWKSSPKLVDQSNVKAKPVINSSVVDSES